MSNMLFVPTQKVMASDSLGGITELSLSCSICLYFAILNWLAAFIVTCLFNNAVALTLIRIENAQYDRGQTEYHNQLELGS
jgi:hypothetical protein